MKRRCEMNLTELYAKADYQDEMGMLFHDDCMNIMNDLKFTAERERERESRLNYYRYSL